MSFVFQAGPTSLVFHDPFAREVSDALERHFGFISDSQYTKLETFIGKLSPPGLVRKPGGPVFCSEELPKSSWHKLQQSAVDLLSPPELHHLLFVNSGRGVYIPGLAEPETIRVNKTESLQVAGLSVLLRELLAYSSAAGLPVEEAGLRELAQKSAGDDSHNPAAAIYVQLMLTAQFALATGCALWLVE